MQLRVGEVRTDLAVPIRRPRRHRAQDRTDPAGRWVLGEGCTWAERTGLPSHSSHSRLPICGVGVGHSQQRSRDRGLTRTVCLGGGL